MTRDVPLTRTEEAMLRAFERACELQVELDVMPRWRVRERRRLEEDLRTACDTADEHRAALGGRHGGRPLREILSDVRRQLDALREEAHAA